MSDILQVLLLLTLTLFMLRILPQSSMYCFRSFSRYSKTSVNDFSVCTISCRVTRGKKDTYTFELNHQRI